jgi:DNA-binding phage protein
LVQTLSKRGNPTLAKLESLLDALGFRLKIERK